MDFQQLLADLNRQRNHLDQAIAALEGLFSGTAGTSGTSSRREASHSQRGRHLCCRTPAAFRDDEKALGRTEEEDWPEESCRKAQADERGLPKAPLRNDEEKMAGEEGQDGLAQTTSTNENGIPCIHAGLRIVNRVAFEPVFISYG